MKNKLVYINSKNDKEVKKAFEIIENTIGYKCVNNIRRADIIVNVSKNDFHESDKQQMTLDEFVSQSK